MTQTREEFRNLLKVNFSTMLPIPRGTEAHLRDALLHVLNTPGSLARPRIVMQTMAVYHLPEEASEQLSIALEYFHTASLLLDDLPCMDNAVERRGMMCLHRTFGDSGAILAALALINRAYSLTWSAVAVRSGELQRRALAYLEARLGASGLLNGQSLDLHFADLPANLDSMQRVALGKTVSLVRLSLVLPAILGDATPQEEQLLERIALFWGLAYQVLDDFKDIQQTALMSGKTPSRDEPLGRPNMATLLGPEKAWHRLQRLIHIGHRAYRCLLHIKPGFAFLAELHGELQLQSEAVQHLLCSAVEVQA